MRILQVAKYYPPVPGGIETFVRDLSHTFVTEGHENLVIAHRHDATEPTELTGAMGRVIRVPSLGEVMYAPIAPRYPAELHKQLQIFKPDMVIVHMPNVSGFWPLFMAVHCPIVIYWHSDVIFPKEKWLHRAAYRGYSLFEKALLRKAKTIVATSKPYLEYSEPLRPFHDKCTVIPLGIAPDRIPKITDADVAEIKEKILGDTATPYVYAAGRFAHYKGFDILVRAAAQTRETHPTLKYIIAGDGETRPEILNLIHTLGLEDHVFCPGHVDDHDYWALMQGCKMFCLPSTERTEAFGVVLLEAMAMGKPCISTDIPGSGTGWVNRHGETGLAVEPGNAKKMTEAIQSNAYESYPRQRALPRIKLAETVKRLTSLERA